MPRMPSSGMLRIAGQEYQVRGQSWLDREWSTSALGNDQVGWDWFALQLEDGRELMYYRLRLRDGSEDAYSAGSLTGPQGELTRLSCEDVQIEVLDRWQSPAAVSYTHLDVYKRQVHMFSGIKPSTIGAMTLKLCRCLF